MFLLIVLPATFETILIVAVAYFFVPLSRKPNIPLRKRSSLHEIDQNDRHPGTGKAQMSRGTVLIGNRKEDNAEIWADNDLAKTHWFMIGSTGAGKTEGLISLAFNALVWVSGFAYVDGKGDVSLFAKIFSLLKQMDRLDDLLVLNYMTGNADTSKKRSDKLSNKYNPFSVGNAESLIQLIVNLMDASGGGGDIWKGRAISFISSVIPALCDLRDKGILLLHIGAIRQALPFPRYFELMNNPSISDRSREMMQAFLYDVPGYKKDKNDNQSGTFLEQYGYQQMQFTRILSSLADTYGHIYHTLQGEVNMKDVVVNRRILLVLLPALEKSRPELANLGKIVVAGMKGMMGGQLGSKVEGSKLELLDKRATTAPSPYFGIFDELGYFLPEDAALMWAQARSLNFSLVAAGQDLQAFYRTSKEETLAIFGSSNIKIFGKLEDPTDTFDLVEKLASEAYVSVVEGYEQDVEGVGGYRSSRGARIDRAKIIELRDLKSQIEGEVHIIVKADVIRARMFYANPELAQEYRLNHFVQVIPPHPDQIKLLTVNSRSVIEQLVLSPLAKRRPRDAGFAYVRSVTQEAAYKRYAASRQGAERGIVLMVRFDESQVGVAVPDVDSEASGGAVSSVLTAAPSTAPALAVAAEPTGTAALAMAKEEILLAPAIEAHVVPSAGAATDVGDQTFDGDKLEAVNVFGSKAKQEFADDVIALGHAALAIINAATESRIPEFVSAARSDAGEAAGAPAVVAAQLNRIAVGLGASEEESKAVVAGVLAVATQGTEYPVPPKPGKGEDKEEAMELVMNRLGSLVSGSGE
ncbi:hypothetical protein [Paraburkholderia sediminicola]|uniref:hypothetical protein n=1 Tax=Paraburkholderia sediminicola TaxID=458836 RepID=UPI0038B8DE8B